ADWAVREGDWKLIGRTRDTTRADKGAQAITMFLANVRTDPSESTNLAEKHADIVGRLKKLHDEHLGNDEEQTSDSKPP
ncbi:MAG TPA: hypothetical protein PK867_15070, partial [Pirellulales bacterium]|nr:hypothetical protein [Pirellulales bacterium]